MSTTLWGRYRLRGTTTMPDEGLNGFLSSLYHALRTRRRRRVIQLLRTSDEFVLTVRSLAKQIAAEEHGVRPAHATGKPYRNAYNALSQTHLPTLADTDIIIYDPKRQRVSKGPNFRIAALLIAIDTPAVQLFQDESDSPG